MFTRYQLFTLPFKEFVTLMALMMSLVALSIDAVLPALAHIGHDLGVENSNEQQLIISYLFIGMACGQLIFGPLSDAIGRRTSLVLGFSVFFAGSISALLVDSFDYLLLSRFLQGLGIAAPRVLATAIIRDQYSGRAMARVMSFVMMIFIIVPMIAPMFGQFILAFANWQAIFAVIALVGLISMIWFLVRQKETLDPADRKRLSINNITMAIKTIFSNRTAIGFTVAAGIISGPFVFYLSSSQQLFQQSYDLLDWFPLYFALLSLAMGLASFVNGKLVVRVGMHKMITIALYSIVPLSAIFVVVAFQFSGLPDLWITTMYMLALFFFVGLLFGNLNALAMEPLGHLAGVGAAVVGSLSTFIAVFLAMFIGHWFNSTVYPLAVSFALSSVLILLIMQWIKMAERTVQRTKQ